MTPSRRPLDAPADDDDDGDDVAAPKDHHHGGSSPKIITGPAAWRLTSADGGAVVGRPITNESGCGVAGGAGSSLPIWLSRLWHIFSQKFWCNSQQRTRESVQFGTIEGLM